MKVYIAVERVAYEGVTIKRVFLDKKSADQYIAYTNDTNPVYPLEIEEHESESFVDYVDVYDLADKVDCILRARYMSSQMACSTSRSCL